VAIVYAHGRYVMRIVVTGHRPNKLPGGYNWASKSNGKIIQWMSNQLQSFTGQVIGCSGMALGIDQMFVFTCRVLGIDYVAYVPCKQQERMWPEHAQKDYKELLSKASSTTYVHDGPYYKGCMQARNLAMRDWALEDNNRVLLVVWNGSPGGTANMVKACKGKMDIMYYDELLKSE